MIIDRVLTSLLLAVFTATAYGQHGRLGGSGTYCRDGWKFSATYVLEPWSLAHQHVSIEGLGEVMHTDATGGIPDTLHRVVDPVDETYWGYDLEVEPGGEIGTAQLRFRPLSLTAERLPKDYHPRQVPNVAAFHALAAPPLPSGTFKSGEVIAVDVMRNPATGQKVVDYIEVEFEPVYRTVTA